MGRAVMAQEDIENLKSLRDQLVGERRNLVASILSDPATTNEFAGELVGLQQLIDAVERAISHESSLGRIEGTRSPTSKGRSRVS